MIRDCVSPPGDRHFRRPGYTKAASSPETPYKRRRLSLFIPPFMPCRAQSRTRNSWLVHSRPDPRPAPGPNLEGSRACASAKEAPVWSIQRQLPINKATEEQVALELKRIYKAIVALESECKDRISRHRTQKLDRATATATTITTTDWSSFVDLHARILNEYSDFIIANSHPEAQASARLQPVAEKYSIPARLWRRAIQDPLDLMLEHLPASREHMLGLASESFSALAMLYECAAPTYSRIWAECMGDLARIRMVIGDPDADGASGERETWAGVSRTWYYKALDEDAGVGRLWHHLAIAARPDVVGQLFYFCKSLCAVEPCVSTRVTIETLFEPVLAGKVGGSHAVDLAVARVHGMIIRGEMNESAFQQARDEYLSLLDQDCRAMGAGWAEFGYRLAIINTSALLSFCSGTNLIAQALEIKDEPCAPFPFERNSSVNKRAFQRAIALNAHTLSVLLRVATPASADAGSSPHHVATYLHALLAFLYSLHRLPCADIVDKRISSRLPWAALAAALNEMTAAEPPYPYAQTTELPAPTRLEAVGRPLPDDYAMRGLVWAGGYFPAGHFARDKGRSWEERGVEEWWMREERRVRCVWLGVRLCGLSGRMAFKNGVFRTIEKEL